MNEKKESFSSLKAVTIIICTLIVCAAVVAVIAISAKYNQADKASEPSQNLESQTITTPSAGDSLTESSNTATDSVQNSTAEVDVNGLREIKIEWVNGNIDVDYYDGSTIVFAESGDVSDGTMHYKTSGGKLLIKEYENMESIKTFTNKEKSLSVKIPRSFTAKELSFEAVSTDITAKELNVSEVEFETVNGDIDASFAVQPKKIDIESVNGDAVLRLPNITGYNLKMSTISGRFSNNAGFSQGDRAMQIDFDSVNGDLMLMHN